MLNFFEQQRFEIQGSLEVNSICDSFEQKARRVPRNICADAAVEAKRAVSNSTKCGLSAFSKSIINCLNEADDAYFLEFVSSLKTFAAEYLDLQLSCIETRDENHRRLQITVMSESNTDRIRIRALQARAQKHSAVLEISLLTGAAGVVRTATDEDFSALLARV